MKEFFKNKGVGYILNIVATALGLVAMICYLVSGTDKSYMTETTVSAIVYVPLIVAVLLNAGTLFYNNSLMKIAAFGVYFLAFALWGYNQAGYIVNVFMGIDGNSFGFAYILTIICMVACMVLSLMGTGSFKKKANASASA